MYSKPFINKVLAVLHNGQSLNEVFDALHSG